MSSEIEFQALGWLVITFIKRNSRRAELIQKHFNRAQNSPSRAHFRSSLKIQSANAFSHFN
jgi:hypothetical protein